MPLTLGPRTIRDDRGKVVTGRSINELLGEVRVEAGKRRFSWRMIGGASVAMVAIYLNAVRGIVQTAQRGGPMLWVLAIVVLFALVYAVWRMVQRARGSHAVLFSANNMTHVRDQAVANVLTASHRCGACGYGLRAESIESDGCVVCTECGAAWNHERLKPTAASPEAVTTELEATLKANERSPHRQHDERFMPCGIATHKERLDGEPPASPRGAEALAVLRRKVLRRRLITCGCVAGTGAALLVVGFVIDRPLNHLGLIIAVAGAVLVVIALCIFGLSEDPKKRKAHYLSHRVCPRCLDELGTDEAFDHCVVCPTCGAAWLASSLGTRV